MRCVPMIAAGLLLGAVLHASTAHAIAPVCVLHNDSAGLAQALADAASSGLSAQIEVEQGTYVVPPSGWIYQFGPRQNVAVLGGYVPGTNCAQRQITASPNTPSTNTILDGQSQNGAQITFGLQLSNPANLPYGTFTIEGFEIRNLENTVASGSGVFITFDVQNAFTGGIVFRYNWVHDVIAGGSVVELHTAGPLTVTNNLIDKNIGAATVYLLSAEYNTAPWRIVNNTIANNTGEGLHIDQSGTYVQLFNNILYADTAADLVAYGSYVELHGDTYGTSTTPSGGNISNHGYAFAGANPGYNTTSFHLSAGSSSINSGAGFAGVLPSQDLDGNSRWVGSNPDRGAFESNTSDQAYWVVTSAADSSHATDASVNCNPGSLTCTLREAITRANATGPSLIGFDLGGSCGPHVILLNSPLPDINNYITVDGFAQPGSARNTVSTSESEYLTETLCVIIEGSIAAQVPSAFVAGPTDYGAQLEVRGITFEGFTGAAVSLSYGSYNWIHGNTFGIETDNNPFVFSNAAGVLVASGATFNTIGGNDPADVNLFGKMSSSNTGAIKVSSGTNGHMGHIIVGNQIGIDGTGSTLGNAGTGIAVQSSSHNEIRLNSIVASGLDGISLNGADANWIHDNQIGALPWYGLYYAPTVSNGGSGVTLTGASAGNAIGAFGPTANVFGYSNAIQNNMGPGVWLQSTAGAGNSVTANDIGKNGPAAGGDLAMDLGSQGHGGIGTVPNGGQIAPVISTSYMIGFDTFLLNFSVTGTGGDQYRVDFYLNNNCDTSGYGPAELPIAVHRVTMPGSGQQTKGISVQLPVYGVHSSPSHVAAMATNMANGNTSEVSNCALLVNDRLFTDDFDPAPVAN